MGGRSSPPPAPPPPSPQEEAEAQIQIERELAAIRAQEAEQARAAEAAELARRQGEFDTGLASARDAASTRVTNRFANEFGVDPNLYTTQISDEIARLAGGVPNLASDPGSYFAGDIATSLRDRLTDTERSGFNRSLDEFAGSGFAENLYTGTEDDAIIDQILSDEFGRASEQLDRAYARGTLSDAGIESARGKLGEQRTAASSRLQEVGGGLLEGFRENARNRVGRARDSIGNLNLGGQFDVEGVRTGLQSGRDTNLAGLEGGLRRGIGNDPLFATSDLIQRGAIDQGLINPAGAGDGSGNLLASAISDRRKKEDKQRGIGTEGVI